MSDFQVQFLSSSGQVLVTGDRIDESLYQLKVIAKSHTEEPTLAMSASLSLAASARPLSLVLWHRRTGHRNCADIVKTAVKGAVTGLHLGDFRRPPVCEGCVFGKLHRCKFPTSTHRATEVGDLIHSDVGGPIHVPTPEGFRYFAIFKDDCSRYTVVKLMKNKNEAGTLFMEYAEMIKTQTGRAVKVLRTDQGTDILGGGFNEYKKKTGLIHQTTNRYTPQQNGDSERTMRTAMEGVRSVSYTNDNSNQLPCNTREEVKELWGEFLLAIVYIFNRLLTSDLEITPFERVFGRKPAVDHFRVLGCRAYPHVPDQLRKELDPKGEACWLVGDGEHKK